MAPRTRLAAAAAILVLVHNPLRDLGANISNAGAAALGYWPNRAALVGAGLQLAAIYASDGPLATLARADAAALIRRLITARADGFVLNDGDKPALAEALGKAHFAQTARSEEILQMSPRRSCPVTLPLE